MAFVTGALLLVFVAATAPVCAQALDESGSSSEQAVTQADKEALLRLAQANVRARGGLGAIDRLNSVRVRGVIRQGALESQLIVLKKRPDMIRVETRAGGRETYVAYDGERAWLWTNDPAAVPQELEGLERRLLGLQARFAGALDNLSLLRVLAYQEVPTTDGAGIEFYRVRLGLSDGSYQDIFIDGETFLEQRVELYALEGESPLVTLYDDYRTISGYPVAHRVTSVFDGETLSETTVEDVRFNLGVIPTLFRPPATKAYGAEK